MGAIPGARLVLRCGGALKLENVTVREYSTFQVAFDVLNQKLFGAALPQCLVTLQRVKRAKGYFWASQFRARRGEGFTDEIAMNPDTFDGRTDTEILSTLAHEMAHLWQAHFGTPGRRGYHNAEWAAKMREIGLQPTDTGERGGKETGESVTHMIEAGGAFALVAAELCGTGFALGGAGFALNWNATPSGPGKSKKSTRSKFECPECGLAMWGKPGARVACSDCSDFDNGDVVELVEQTAAGESAEKEAAA